MSIDFFSGADRVSGRPEINNTPRRHSVASHNQKLLLLNTLNTLKNQNLTTDDTDETDQHREAKFKMQRKFANREQV